VAVIDHVESAAGPCSESSVPRGDELRRVLERDAMPTPPPVTVPAPSPVSVQSEGRTGA
jgi:hypothetical protein